jgi:hypothetical protein
MPKTRLCLNCGITTITKSKNENSRPLFNGMTKSNLQFSLEKQHCCISSTTSRAIRYSKTVFDNQNKNI